MPLIETGPLMGPKMGSQRHSWVGKVGVTPEGLVSPSTGPAGYIPARGGSSRRGPCTRRGHSHCGPMPKPPSLLQMGIGGAKRIRFPSESAQKDQKKMASVVLQTSEPPHMKSEEKTGLTIVWVAAQCQCYMAKTTADVDQRLPTSDITINPTSCGMPVHNMFGISISVDLGVDTKAHLQQHKLFLKLGPVSPFACLEFNFSGIGG
jgi:hypothetical protein